MAQVRIFLPTFRRANLLPRALSSLRAQTFTDWICEVHNDDPTDDTPRQLIQRIGDDRVSLVTHARNQGGTATFNLFFRATPEPFYSMLEDDNWWDPEFLSTLLAAAQDNPEAKLIWANLRLWREMDDGTFHNTGRTVWPCDGPRYQSFNWGNQAQLCGALHSHGAALIRSLGGENFTTPEVPIAAVEPFRERALPHPVVLVTAPLANFSITQKSARDADHGAWGEAQTALAATFLKHASLSEAEHREIWHQARLKAPPTTGILIAAALSDPANRQLLRYSTAGDWLRWIRSSMRRPFAAWQILHSRQRRPEWWDFLEFHTAARSRERGLPPRS